MAKKEKKVENNLNTAKEIAEEYKDKETYNMTDIIKLMKKSGLSYKQIMQGIKQIGKETEEYAKEHGDDFDRKAFLRQKMEEQLGNASKK